MVERIIESELIWKVKTDSREEQISASNWEDFEERFWKLFDEIQKSPGRNIKRKGNKNGN